MDAKCSSYRSSLLASTVLVKGVLLVALFCCPALKAATITWDGGAATGAWATGLNWSTNTVPANTDSLVFNAAGANNQFSITLGANRTTAGITFNNAAGTNAFTFNAGSTLTINAGGIVNNDTDTQIFNSAITVGSAQTWNTASGGLTFGGAVTLSNTLTLSGANTLTVNGTLTNNAGSRTITNNSTGSVTFSAVNLANNNTANRTLTINGSGNTSITGVVANGGTSAENLTKAGTGTLTLSGNNTYTGTTTVSAGTLIAANNNALGTTAGTTTVGSGGTLAFQGVNYSTAEAVSVTGTGAAGSNGAIDNTSGTSSFAGAITLAGNTTMGAAGGSQLTLSGVITDGASTFGLTKAGAGTLVLSSGANTYTGATTINAGTLSMSSLGNGGTASNLGNSSNAATNLVLNGGTLQYTGAGATTDRLFSVGTGGGTIDASGSNALNFNNTGSMAFNGQTGTRTLTLTGTSTNANTIAAIIGDNTGATSVAKTGAGTWVLSGANTYTGATNITGGTLQITNSNALGTIPGGNVNISNGGTLDIGGDVTVNDVNFGTKQFYISGSGVGGNGAIINSGVAQTNPTGVFQKIALTADATIGGTSRWDMRGGTPNLDLAGFTLTKTGSNQISVVSGVITGGNITVNQGEFAIQKTTYTSGTGTYTFNNGTTLGLWANPNGAVTATMVFNGTNTVLNESGTSIVNSPMTITGITNFNNLAAAPSLTLAGQLTINAGAAANFNVVSGTSLTLAGPLAGTGTATLNGADTTSILNLGANQVFNGELDLAGGTLALNGHSLTVSTLRITGDSTIDFGSGLASILDTTNLYFANSGITLTITNWTDAMDYFYSTNNPGLTSLSQIVFDPPTYTGSDTKWLPYTDGPYNDHQITPVPEPGTYGALFTAAALGLFLWQRRRLRTVPVVA